MTNLGTAYGGAPITVTFSGGTIGTGAEGYAVLTGDEISSIVVTNQGTGYYEAPDVYITSASGYGAEAQTQLSKTVINYEAPTNGHTITIPHMTGTIAVLENDLDLSVPGDLFVTGDATMSGDLTFGNQTSDTVTFVADVDSHIVPEVSGTYNLGSPTYP